MLNIVLISTYALGHQPFGLASPKAWLKELGHDVHVIDTSIERIDVNVIRDADFVAYYIPMHTATKLAVTIHKKIKEINPAVLTCFYGLYAPVNEGYLRKIGGDIILGGEFEEGLIGAVKRLEASYETGVLAEQIEPVISLKKQSFKIPDRSGLAGLEKYGHLSFQNAKKTVGYTEASRGCKHLCTHCPIVPVYNGQFRIVQKEVVLKDIENQINQGAQHITFGDPDFFNGPGHSIRIVEELHERFPEVTYDVIIKIEHLIKHQQHLAVLRNTGCILITSAVESFDDTVLLHLKKDHTKDDFIQAIEMLKRAGIAFQPTFVAFTPWTTPETYFGFLKTIYDLDLIHNVPPIQYGIRLLIPAGSKLLLDPSIARIIEEFDEPSLYYPWRHPNDSVDMMQREIMAIIENGQTKDRESVFFEIWEVARMYSGSSSNIERSWLPVDSSSIPVLSEAWYCCAEPAQHQVEKSFI